MKKLLIMVLFVISLSLLSNNIFAATKKCDDDDFATGAHGCKNTYEVRDRDGKMTTRECTDPMYAEKTNNCKNEYEVANIFSDPVLQDPTDADNTDGVPNKLKNVIGDAWATVVVLVQIASVACVVFAGVRYMFASADQKADIKTGLMHLTIGAILVFGAVTIIQFVVNAFEEIV